MSNWLEVREPEEVRSLRRYFSQWGYDPSFFDVRLAAKGNEFYLAAAVWPWEFVPKGVKVPHPNWFPSFIGKLRVVAAFAICRSDIGDIGGVSSQKVGGG